MPTTRIEPNSDYASARPSKFRVKSTKRGRDDDDDPVRKRRRGDANHEQATRMSRHRVWDKVHDDPSAYDDTYEPNIRTSQYEDPNASFRESLFDALADDEGAAYWEGVYGQPIHVYDRPQSQRSAGELESMNDEEYAEYVRAKMWEKTHQHVIEEQQRREERKKREREEREREAREGAKKRREHERWQSMVDESIRAGEQRRKGKRWKEAWDDYTRRWQSLASAAAEAEDDAEHVARRIIPWPVVTGRWKDTSKLDVEDFFDHRPEDMDLTSCLKTERVRWHPDKMQQRFGVRRIDSETLKSVTTVFQVVDTMWNEARGKSNR